MVLFTIIIPITSKKFYYDCINSVLLQTFDDYEIICFNFNKDTHSSKILFEFSKKFDNIRIVEPDEIMTKVNVDKNFKINLNYYLEFVRGQYVLILHCEDWINLDTLKILNHHIKDNELDILLFEKYNFNENKLYDYHKYFKEQEFNHKINNFNFISDILNAPLAYLYNVSFLKNNINFLENFNKNFSILFLEILLKSNKISLINLDLYNERFKKTNQINDININNYLPDFIKKIESINLEDRNDFYKCFRKKLLGFVNFEIFENFLDEKSSLIYDYILIYNNYLDFITEYLTNTVEYLEVIESKEKKYKLSVIVPIYNTGKILNRTLSCLLKQTFSDFEVIMVNDFSDDDLTNKIAKDYAENNDNFKLIYLDNNHGSAGIPRNIGIKESKSDFIMFLDHEDFYEHDACEFLYNEITNKNCDLVFGNYNVIKKDCQNIYYDPDVNPGFYNNIKENLLFYHSPGASIWTKIFKKELVIKNNILFVPILGEDWIFLFKYFEVAKGIQYDYDKVVYNYDLRDISTTTNISLKYFIEGFVGECYIYHFFKNHNDINYFKYRIYVFNYFLTLFANSELDECEIKRLQPLIYNHFLIFHSLGMSDWDFTKKELINIISKNNYEKLVNYFPHLKKTILYITVLNESNELPLIDNLNKLLIYFNLYALTYENFEIKLWKCNSNKIELIDEIKYHDKIINFSQLNKFYELIFKKYLFDKVFFRHFESYKLMHTFRTLNQSQRITPLSFTSKKNIPVIYGKDSEYLLNNINFNFNENINIDVNNEKGVVYTAIFGDFESLLDPKYINDELDYICFTDNENLKSSVWEIRLTSEFCEDFGFIYTNTGEKISFNDLDSTRKARAIKILPHKFLKDYDFSIWVDAGFMICDNLIEYVNRYSESDFLAVKHSVRHCIYDEAQEIINGNIDDKNLVLNQITKYHDEGFPRNYGLIESGVLFRRHNKIKIIQVMTDWFKEVLNFSKRDQLSFNYVSWKNNFKYDVAKIYIVRNPYFHHYYHIKSVPNNKILLNQFRILIIDNNNLKDLNDSINSINSINDFIPVTIITNNDHLKNSYKCPYNVEIYCNVNELKIQDFIDIVKSNKSEDYVHIIKSGEIFDYEIILNSLNNS